MKSGLLVSAYRRSNTADRGTDLNAQSHMLNQHCPLMSLYCIILAAASKKKQDVSSSLKRNQEKHITANHQMRIVPIDLNDACVRA